MKSIWILANIGVLALIFAIGCSKKLNPEEYLAHVEKDGEEFCKTIERNGFLATVCYRPKEYYAAREMRIDTTLSAQKALNRYSKNLIFTCNVKAENALDDGRMLLQGNGFADYGKNVKKHTFGKKEDIFLVNGKDTIQVTEYQYERNWGIGSGDTFVMSFLQERLKSNPQKYKLIIRDMLPEIGTIDIKVADLLRSTRGLKD